VRRLTERGPWCLAAHRADLPAQVGLIGEAGVSGQAGGRPSRVRGMPRGPAQAAIIVVMSHGRRLRLLTSDDLFEEEEDPWDPLPSQRFRTELVTQAIAKPIDGVDDLELGITLAQLLQIEFTAYGTGGGNRLTDPQANIALRALKAVSQRLGVTYGVSWRDFTSFRAYWEANDGYGSWAARRRMVGEAFGPPLDRLYELQDAPTSPGVVTVAVNALQDPAAIHDHLRRLVVSVDSDPRLAVSVAKDLVESTAKLVLRERGESVTGKEDLPALVARAQAVLQLSAAGVEASDEARTLKTILGSLSRLTQGVTELRNRVGVGHGREAVPTWVRPRHARLAAGAAATWCNLMLETLGDPDAPWRQRT